MDSTPTSGPTPCNKGIADLVSHTLKLIDDGFTKFEKVSDETARMRIAICEGCTEHFIIEERRCDLCCCPMDFKVTLKYDPIKGVQILKKTPITCPISKW